MKLYLLQEEDDPDEHLGVQLLQGEQGPWRADEEFGLAIGHVVLEAVDLNELLHSVLV